MASLMPQGKQQYFDLSGNPLSGGRVYTYASGTDTPLSTYTTAAGSIANANPVVLDSRGEASIFWGSDAYKVVLKDADDAEIWTQDNLSASGAYQEIGTYALLRAYTGGSTVFYVRGVASIFDGGAGIFRIDPSDTTSADNGGTILVDALGRRWMREFSGEVNAKWFGASGNGSTDDTAAVQAAIDFKLSSGARGVVYLPPGTYRLTSTITVNGVSCEIAGEDGEISTVFLIDHATGPGVHLKNRRNALRNIEITGSAARSTSEAGTNYGVLLEPDDISGRRCSYNVIDNVYVQDHPSHGIVAVGGVWFSEFKRLTIRDNNGHGLVFDNGSISGRTNKENPGIVELNRLEIFDNDGHGVLIGNDNESSNRGFRFDIRNVDLYRNAEAAGLRKQAAQMWAFLDTSSISISAFDGRNKAQSAVVTQGVWLHGRSVSIERNRFLNVATTAVTIGAPINGFNAIDIRVAGNYVFDNSSTNPSLDPAVDIDSSAVNVFVDWPNTQEVARPKPTSNVAPIVRSMVIFKAIDETRNNTATAADDSELSIALPTNVRVSFRFVVFYVGDATADIKFAVNGPSGTSVMCAPSSSMKINGSDALSPQPALAVGNTFAAGAHASDIRCCEISGIATTGVTAGNLRLQWAQSSAQLADTTVKAGSYLQVQL